MTAAQHTPGPWANDKHIITANGIDIAEVYFPGAMGSRLSLEQARADVRLISAAPELLAALRRLTECPDLCLDTLEAESVAATAAAYAATAYAARISVLKLAAAIGIQALRECAAHGVELLDKLNRA